MAIMDMPICFGKKLNLLIALLFLLNIHTIDAKPIPQPIEVKIGLMESLSAKAPSSSERYRRLYEGALLYAIGKNEHKLRECGYKIVPSIIYFDTYAAQDLINATKQLEQSQSWIIIGPRRSNQFLTATKHLVETPMISTMANAEEIYKSNKLTFSMYPPASQLAKLMVKEIKKEALGKTFGTVVDVRCDPCIDFARSFRQHNTNSTEAFYLEVATNTPDLTSLKNYITKLPIDYLLLPNYSDLSGFIIAEVQKINPSIKFIGADGWGEDSFSFLQGYGIRKNTVGFTIRAGAKKEDKSDHYQAYSLDREVNGTVIVPPYSIYALVKLMRILSEDLCNSHAKTKNDFKNYITNQSSSHFQKQPLYSIYHFEDGQLKFSHYIKDK